MIIHSDNLNINKIIIKDSHLSTDLICINYYGEEIKGKIIMNRIIIGNNILV